MVIRANGSYCEIHYNELEDFRELRTFDEDFQELPFDIAHRCSIHTSTSQQERHSNCDNVHTAKVQSTKSWAWGWVESRECNKLQVVANPLTGEIMPINSCLQEGEKLCK